MDPTVLAKEYNLDATEQGDLRDGIDRLPFLSAPMSGFTDHLLTIVQGSHIKPTKRAPGAQPEPLQEALDSCADAKITADHLRAMGLQTNKTPYGSSVPVNARNSPFKPATHGQWQFSKLNVIDKFGQALTIVDQSPKKFTDPDPTVYPCVSDYFAVDRVQVSHNNQPSVLEYNSILGEPDNTRCRFVQVPPTLNQACRLNTTFVIPDEKNRGLWREAAVDHENPVWGWVVVNYADYGIQLFLADGTFYREVRVNPSDTTGSGGSSVSPPWAPFDPPSQFNPNQVTQLDKLVQQLVNRGPKGDYAYLFAIANMINNSILNMPHLPNSYAGFLPGLVGKPLALVNLGISLELGQPPLKSQSNVVSAPGGHRREEPTLDTYGFPVKIGDGKRAFDGLVGYFPSTLDTKGNVDLDLSRLYTYFPMQQPPIPPPTPPIHVNISEMNIATEPTTGTDPTIPIGPDNYPTVTPFYIPTAPDDTWDPLSGTLPPAPSAPTSLDDFILLRNKQLKVFGAVMDPFSPIHFYSGSIVPVVSLKLPDSTLGDAMSRMTAFIRAGPVLVTQDVPINLDTAAVLRASYTLDGSSNNSSASANGTAGASVPSETPPPAVQVGGLGGKGREKWRWLQPYWADPVPDSPSARIETTGKITQYNALPLTFSSTKPRLEGGPYTALEGYLQLAEPIVKPTF
ncbi:hypothetical protein CNMCM5793_006129 [Aspergillus hiratsukae]|uniref:Uncharacterized protein n=1 Tax=Aspergillus hiratsukae TaxID=1194566 RepID=A0A8H6P1C7_9EURO|nr:hypothetical protein CNMCM5793_006129 [Aspergillus hiratsukae]